MSVPPDSWNGGSPILELVLTIAATAVLSSLLTLWLLTRWLKRRFLPLAEERLGALMTSKGEELGEVIEQRVRNGARQGMSEGLAMFSSPERISEGLQGATESVGRAARSLVESGLSGLMGGGKRPRQD